VTNAFNIFDARHAVIWLHSVQQQ